MADLEGLTNKLLDDGSPLEHVKLRLTEEILTFKQTSGEKAGRLTEAVISEVLRSRERPRSGVFGMLLNFPKSHVTMADMGVGCRGEGDIFVHRLIARLASAGGLKPVLGPLSLDDAGAVYHSGVVVTVAVDGTHSRLSSFPFLAGFHVARACLRDVYVKGAKPVALFDDVHLADDGDVGKLFDFVAGVNTVVTLTGVPLVSGSTLRVGGDMVVGDRMVSCVGAVGVARDPKAVTARRNVKPGDAILMTEGAGGGTVTTAAVYSGNFDVVLETLNINFLEVCSFLLDSGLTSNVHAMTDVTNGGLRGDANTICREAGVGLVIDGETVENLVNEKVLRMLNTLKIDHLGVSLDSLLMFTPQENVDEVEAGIRKLGVKVARVGYAVEKPRKARVSRDGKLTDLKPRFRESAYTEVKKVVGEEAGADKQKLESSVIKAFNESVKKRNLLLKYISSRGKTHGEVNDR